MESAQIGDMQKPMKHTRVGCCWCGVVADFVIFRFRRSCQAMSVIIKVVCMMSADCFVTCVP